MTLKKLIKLTFDYGNGSSIREMIASDYQYQIQNKRLNVEEKKEILDAAIQSTFQIVRHWFQYKVPKWIGVVNSIQEYICEGVEKKPGNYSYYAKLIENEGIPENIALLLEYNIPASTIKKIMNLIPENLKDQDLIKYICDNKVYENYKLLEYEKIIVKNNLLIRN